MNAPAAPAPSGFVERLRVQRRKRVKRFGKNFIRSLSGFIGRQSLVGDLPVYENRDFPFIKTLEDNWRVIRSELDEILKHRDAIPSFVELSRDQTKIASDQRWRTFVLYGFGEKAEHNCRKAPRTADLLAQVPNLQTAFISILGPNYHVPAHRGVSKTILRSHLGLIVPDDAANCTMRIGDQKVSWREGEAFVFDDTYDHEVRNDTDQERVVLLFDFDRPMKFWGRALHKAFVFGLRQTAYFREPKRKLKSLEARFDAAVRRSQDRLEGS